MEKLLSCLLVQTEPELLLSQFAIDNVCIEIFWIGSGGQILYANHHACQALGYSKEELKLLSLADLDPQYPIDQWNQFWQEIKQFKVKSFETLHKKKDGGIYPVQVVSNFVSYGSQEFCIGFVTDISERKEKESKLLRIQQLYSAVIAADRLIFAAKSPTEIFNGVCKIAVELGGMKMAWVGIPNETDQRMVPVASYGKGTDYLDNVFISVRADILEGQGPSGISFREGRTVINQDFQRNQITKLWHDYGKTYGWGSSATFAIMLDVKPYAALTVYSAEINAFDSQQIALLEGLALSISQSLERNNNLVKREQAEQAVRESERKLSILLDYNKIHMWAFDGTTYTYTNKQWFDYTGQSPNDHLTIERWVSVVHPDDLEKSKAIWLANWEAKTEHDNYFRLLRYDGIYRDFYCHALPVFNERGTFVHFQGFNLDITESKRAEENLLVTASVYENTLDSIVITDAKNTIIDVNPSFTRITGYSREEVVGKDPTILSSGQHNKAFYTKMWEKLNRERFWHGEIWNRKKSGEVYAELLSINAICDNNDKVVRYVAVFSDITYIKEQEAELKQIAHFDVLTGIPNRVLLADRMKQAIAQTSREKNIMAVCYLDLDGFKTINDNFGHKAGDEVLIEVAHRISNTIRGGDTVARLGGDEFLILLLGLERKEESVATLERLIAAVSEPMIIQGKSCTVSASIGASFYPSDNEDPDNLLHQADQSMLRAKKSGKNRFKLYEPALKAND